MRAGHALPGDRIPQFVGDPEFFQRANALCNSPLDAVADIYFIVIVTRRIKMSVASSDCLKDGGFTDIAIGFPKSEADGRDSLD